MSWIDNDLDDNHAGQWDDLENGTPAVRGVQARTSTGRPTPARAGSQNKYRNNGMVPGTQRAVKAAKLHATVMDRRKAKERYQRDRSQARAFKVLDPLLLDVLGIAETAKDDSMGAGQATGLTTPVSACSLHGSSSQAELGGPPSSRPPSASRRQPPLPSPGSGGGSPALSAAAAVRVTQSRRPVPSTGGGSAALPVVSVSAVREPFTSGRAQGSWAMLFRPPSERVTPDNNACVPVPPRKEQAWGDQHVNGSSLSARHDKIEQDREEWSARIRDVLSRPDEAYRAMHDAREDARALKEQLILLSTATHGWPELDQHIKHLEGCKSTAGAIMQRLQEHRAYLSAADIAGVQAEFAGELTALAVVVCDSVAGCLEKLPEMKCMETDVRVAVRVSCHAIQACAAVARVLEEGVPTAQRCDATSVLATEEGASGEMEHCATRIVEASLEACDRLARDLLHPNSLTPAAPEGHETSTRELWLRSLWHGSTELVAKCVKHWDRQALDLTHKLGKMYSEAARLALSMMADTMSSRLGHSEHHQLGRDADHSFDSVIDVLRQLDLHCVRSGSTSNMSSVVGSAAAVPSSAGSAASVVAWRPQPHYASVSSSRPGPWGKTAAWPRGTGSVVSDEELQSHLWLPGLLLDLHDKASGVHKKIRELLTPVLAAGGSSGFAMSEPSTSAVHRRSANGSGSGTLIGLCGSSSTLVPCVSLQSCYDLLDELQERFSTVVLVNLQRTAWLCNASVAPAMWALEKLREQAEHALLLAKAYDSGALGFEDVLAEARNGLKSEVERETAEGDDPEKRSLVRQQYQARIDGVTDVLNLMRSASDDVVSAYLYLNRQLRVRRKAHDNQDDAGLPSRSPAIPSLMANPSWATNVGVPSRTPPNQQHRQTAHAPADASYTVGTNYEHHQEIHHLAHVGHCKSIRAHTDIPDSAALGVTQHISTPSALPPSRWRAVVAATTLVAQQMLVDRRVSEAQHVPPACGSGSCSPAAAANASPASITGSYLGTGTGTLDVHTPTRTMQQADLHHHHHDHHHHHNHHHHQRRSPSDDYSSPQQNVYSSMACPTAKAMLLSTAIKESDDEQNEDTGAWLQPRKGRRKPGLVPRSSGLQQQHQQHQSMEGGGTDGVQMSQWPQRSVARGGSHGRRRSRASGGTRGLVSNGQEHEPVWTGSPTSTQQPASLLSGQVSQPSTPRDHVSNVRPCLNSAAAESTSVRALFTNQNASSSQVGEGHAAQALSQSRACALAGPAQQQITAEPRRNVSPFLQVLRNQVPADFLSRDAPVVNGSASRYADAVVSAGAHHSQLAPQSGGQRSYSRPQAAVPTAQGKQQAATGVSTPHVTYATQPDDRFWHIPFSYLRDQLIKPLSSGAFGCVWRGKYLNGEVAIKVVKPGKRNLTSEEDAKERLAMIERFHQEVYYQRFLSHHPNIVRFIGACYEYERLNEDGLLAIVMECCMLGTLFKICKSARQVGRTMRRSGAQPTNRSINNAVAFWSSWETRFQVAQGAAAGVQFMHHHNIIHRDLTSNNLVLDRALLDSEERGQRDVTKWVAKVCDFNLSRTLAPDQQQIPTTGSMYSPLWTAPELLTTEKGFFGKEADVYSFGIILWEILTLNIPYSTLLSDSLYTDEEFDNERHLQTLIARVTINVPHGTRPMLPASAADLNGPPLLRDAAEAEKLYQCLRDLIEDAWNESPKSRPTMEKVADVLKSVLEQVSNDRAAARAARLKTQSETRA